MFLQTLTWHLVLVYMLKLLDMYIAPGQGETTPWGQMLMSTESPYYFAHLVQVLKKIWFYTHFNYFVHVYSPGARADNPLEINFWCQQTALINLPICCRFKTNCFEGRFYIHFFMFHHMYIAPVRQNFDANSKAFSLCSYVASFKMTFLMIIYMHIAPGQGQKTPWGQNFDVNRKPLSFRPFVASFKQISLNSDFIHILMLFHMYIAPGQGQTTLCGQNRDVNRNALSLCPIVASFKKYLWSLILNIIFH